MATSLSSFHLSYSCTTRTSELVVCAGIEFGGGGRLHCMQVGRHLQTHWMPTWEFELYTGKFERRCLCPTVDHSLYAPLSRQSPEIWQELTMIYAYQERLSCSRWTLYQLGAEVSHCQRRLLRIGRGAMSKALGMKGVTPSVLPHLKSATRIIRWPHFGPPK